MLQAPIPNLFSFSQKNVIFFYKVVRTLFSLPISVPRSVHVPLPILSLPLAFTGRMQADHGTPEI